MAARSLDARVEILEQKVEGLQKLPARIDAVESQILQLRDEMRVEFSAIRDRLGNHDRQFEAIDRRFQAVNERFDSIDHRLDETNRHMRVLHEEVLTRLSLLQESRSRRKR
jgi:hypothetical protein